MSRLWIAMCWMVVWVLLGCRPVQAATAGSFDLKAEPPRLVVQTGHAKNVNSVAFSPNGKTVVSGDGKGIIKLWDLATGRELRTLKYSGSVNSVAFSPDNRTVVLGGDRYYKKSDHSIKLWDVVTGRVRTLAGHKNSVKSVAFSPDGKTVVSGSWDNTIKLWNVTTGRGRNLAWHEKSVNSVAFSPDGKTVVSGNGLNSDPGNIKLWNVRTGRAHTLAVVKKGVSSVAFSPDGKTVVSASYDDNTIKLWDVAEVREPYTFTGHTDQVNSVAFSPDGKTVVSGSHDGSIKVWNVDKSEEPVSLPCGALTMGVAFSPSLNNKIVAAASWDNTIKLWDLANKQVKHTLGHPSDTINSIAFSPDGKNMVLGRATQSSTTLKFWDLSKGQEESSLVGQLESEAIKNVVFLPDGKTVVLEGARPMKLWDVVTGRKLTSFVFTGHVGQVSSIALSPDGKTVVSGHIARTRGAVWLDLSPDDKIVVSVGGGGDETIKLWEVDTGTELRTLVGHKKGLNCVAFSSDGETVVAGSSNNNTIKRWDVATGRKLSTLSVHGRKANTLVAFSSDRKTMVLGSYKDDTITLLDVFTGRELQIPSGPVNIVAFFPDGKTVVSGGDDATIKLWRVADGALLATLVSFSDGRWAVIDPEGRFDVADLDDMPYLHWIMPDDPMTPLPIEIFMRDYYEPRLLPRILNGEKFESVRALSELNRVQPEVRITGIEPDSEQRGYVKVTVEAAGASRSHTPEGKPIATAVHDLRLFRNGQLVGYAGDKDEDKPLSKAGGKPFQRSFRVRLPGGKEPLQFTVYAFNDDRVKSATAHRTYTPPGVIVGSKPRAYLITIGVNRYDDPAWKDLHYAANDARQIGESLEAGLAGQNKYEAEDIVTIPLISDTEGPRLATKANLKAVLDVLAGREADVRAIPGGEKLRQATPDDFVLISFSGHGYGEGGMFYLVPSDTGERNGKSKAITSELIAKSISSDELSAWLRDVDAGNMVMIVDACHSAASVGEKFKPGPMGSRGLGQLAFDKGMRILAASQADDVALEIDHLKHGLLSSALIVDGMKRFSADRAPKDGKITLDEWLRYGVDQVPILAKKVKAGEMQVAGRGMKEKIKVDGKLIDKPDQQPALFDFSKNRLDVVVAVE